MSAHKKFDDYIKGLFEGKPDVPAELSWESMNFDLPEAPQPKKDSKKKYLLLLLLLLIGGSALYLVFSENTQANPLTYEANAKQNLEKSISDQLAKAEVKTECLIETPSPTKNTISKDKTTNTVKEIVKRIETKETKIDKLSPVASSRTDVFSFKNEKNQTQTIDIKVGNIEEIKPVFSDEKKEMELEISLLSARPIANLPINLLNNLDKKMNIKPLKEGNGKERLFKVKQVFIGYGYNNFNLKSDISLILIERPESTWGKSFTAGLRLDINEKWNSNVRLNYHEYHSVLDYSRDLDPVIDTANLIKINREEITYHNNYTRTLGLQVGIERRFQITEKLSLYTGINLSPQYIISANGKEVVAGEPRIYDDEIGDLSLSGGLSTALVFPISRSTNLELNYQFNQFFSKKLFINSGIYSNQQSVLSVIISQNF